MAPERHRSRSPPPPPPPPPRRRPPKARTGGGVASRRLVPFWAVALFFVFASLLRAHRETTTTPRSGSGRSSGEARGVVDRDRPWTSSSVAASPPAAEDGCATGGDGDGIGPKILLAGISRSDATVSDAAADFLVRIACDCSIPVRILLAERDDERRSSKLEDKLAAFARLRRPLEEDGGVAPRMECLDSIEVTVEPIEVVVPASANASGEGANRIERIVRARDRQRDSIREELEKSSDAWGDGAAIAVADLDLLAYPPPADLVATARRHVLVPSPPPSAASRIRNRDDDVDDEAPQLLPSPLPSESEKYHAICSHGLVVEMSKSQQKHVTRYYDTYSTILLPNAWIHRDRVVPRGSLEGEDLQAASMNQEEVFDYFLREGRRIADEGRANRAGDDGDNDNGDDDHHRDGDDVPPGGTREGTRYAPVPVRSCFNGLTLYRADVWLSRACRYGGAVRDGAEYASGRYGRPCEHVTLHECLRRTMQAEAAGGTRGGGGASKGSFSIAVKPDWTTLWHGL